VYKEHARVGPPGASFPIQRIPSSRWSPSENPH